MQISYILLLDKYFKYISIMFSLLLIFPLPFHPFIWICYYEIAHECARKHGSQSEWAVCGVKIHRVPQHHLVKYSGDLWVICMHACMRASVWVNCVCVVHVKCESVCLCRKRNQDIWPVNLISEQGKQEGERMWAVMVKLLNPPHLKSRSPWAMEQQGVPQITPSISSLDWINMTL